MFQILLIITGIASIGCLCAMVICLIAISRENQVPDFEEIKIG